MTPKELRQLIARGESQMLDFKQTITDTHKIAKTLVSFANTHGGKILVGVRDDHQIVGADPEAEVFVLQEAAEYCCAPPLRLSYSQVEDDETGQTVLIVDVPDSRQKPHAAIDAQGHPVIYIRSNDKSLIASKMMQDAMRTEPRKPRRKLLSHEQKLLSVLHKRERITVREYADMVNISERRARQTLTAMTLDGLLQMHDLEKDNYYTLG